MEGERRVSSTKFTLKAAREVAFSVRHAMREAPALSFAALETQLSLLQSFLLRAPGISVEVDRYEAVERLRPHFEQGIHDLGIDAAQIATAEQVHGAGIAVVDSPTGLDRPLPGVDGLITTAPGLLLGIYVADCCAVYIADRHGRGIALVHSGKKGTELGIAPLAIEELRNLGVEPTDLTVQLSPCIRPPAYELDFAAQIRADCQAAGVPAGQIFDDQICTSTDLERFYSYRVEMGKTGRMLALLGIRA